MSNLSNNGKKQQNEVCMFCGRYSGLKYGDKEIKLIRTPANQCVCSKCIEDMSSLLPGFDMSSKHINELSETGNDWRSELPRDLKAYLDQFVVGQDSAKKVLCVAVYNHLKRIRLGDPSIQKSNVLMMGPSGSGKTYLVELLAKHLGIPMIVVDVTGITKSGYAGESVSSIMTRLLIAANGNVGRAQQGIIVLDEVDKLAKKSSIDSLDIGGESVQQELLKLIEGTVAHIEITRGEQEKTIQVNTKSILFICTGAFCGLEKIISDRMSSGRKQMGFSAQTKEEQNIQGSGILTNVQADDLLKFGLVSELVGRLPVRVCLTKLTEENLVDVMLNTKDNILNQYQKLLRTDGVELEFTYPAILKAAKLAYNQNTGARAVRSIIEATMTEVMFSTPGSGQDKIVITEEMISTYVNIPA